MKGHAKKAPLKEIPISSKCMIPLDRLKEFSDGTIKIIMKPPPSLLIYILSHTSLEFITSNGVLAINLPNLINLRVKEI